MLWDYLAEAGDSPRDNTAMQRGSGIQPIFTEL
jgi:hypothetical protein